MRLSTFQRVVAGFALLVGIAMVLMKLLPGIPGRFTIYEWLALGGWIVAGSIASMTKRHGPEAKSSSA